MSHNAKEDPEGELVVVVIKGRHLPNRELIGKQSPFCVFRLGPAGPRKRTKIDQRGGQKPEWDEQLNFDIKDTERRLFIQVFHEDGMNNELIGETVIDISDALNNGELDDWFQLKYHGKYAGELYLEFTFYQSLANLKPPLLKNLPPELQQHPKTQHPTDIRAHIRSDSPSPAAPNPPQFQPQSYEQPPVQRPVPHAFAPKHQHQYPPSAMRPPVPNQSQPPGRGPQAPLQGSPAPYGQLKRSDSYPTGNVQSREFAHGRGIGPPQSYPSQAAPSRYHQGKPPQNNPPGRHDSPHPTPAYRTQRQNSYPEPSHSTPPASQGFTPNPSHYRPFPHPDASPSTLHNLPPMPPNYDNHRRGNTPPGKPPPNYNSKGLLRSHSGSHSLAPPSLSLNRGDVIGYPHYPTSSPRSLAHSLPNPHGYPIYTKGYPPPPHENQPPPPVPKHSFPYRGPNPYPASPQPQNSGLATAMSNLSLNAYGGNHPPYPSPYNGKAPTNVQRRMTRIANKSRHYQG
ncbi:uncharacterized protein VTP21DRAFT_5673 [Calcarisporiella thermophila]|uniref:uncharacterized protein n=1 Tax=Calcarisporiella thermophila TaxID=911321 RepID=UPI003743D5AD